MDVKNLKVTSKQVEIKCVNFKPVKKKQVKEKSWLIQKRTEKENKKRNRGQIG